MSSDRRLTAEELHRKMLARWENEGGAHEPSLEAAVMAVTASERDSGTGRTGRRKPRAASPGATKQAR
jgi:hypothetical protein